MTAQKFAVVFSISIEVFQQKFCISGRSLYKFYECLKLTG